MKVGDRVIRITNGNPLSGLTRSGARMRGQIVSLKKDGRIMVKWDSQKQPQSISYKYLKLDNPLNQSLIGKG